MSHQLLGKVIDHFACRYARLTAEKEKCELSRAESAAPQSARAKKHVSHTRSLQTGLVLAFIIALVPFVTFAANPFGDLNPGSPHNGNIDAIYTAGITTGCDPTSYCPNGNVTREEMASFLARTAGLGNNRPVANAARLAPASPTAGGPTYAANDLVRVGVKNLSPDLSNITNTTEQPFGAPLTITAPAAGFVLVTASVEFTYVSGTCPCNAAALIRHTQGPAASTPLAATVANGSTDYRALVPLTWVFPVQPGNNSFQVVVRKSATGPGTGTVGTFGGTVTGLFVPFGSTGAGSLGTDNTPQTPEQ